MSIEFPLRGLNPGHVKDGIPGMKVGGQSARLVIPS